MPELNERPSYRFLTHSYGKMGWSGLSDCGIILSYSLFYNGSCPLKYECLK